ncbi:MAG TPA: heme-binding protein [Trinickia sp.]|jgi:uncharacterized protein GlcG (DUF336 family)|uniref:GlcG/HbpS family heme-binding protein n=1 Tax=Trinickia sp. TaxID=2571163 RepID=UPI002C9E54D9|nr:heme-binding protein [Trinickia sp.]HTI16660.1 heme-binding protein [Trinickia sp.]
MNLELAQALLNQAKDRIQQQFGRPACISVCDAYGFQIGFIRMDGAPVRSIALSRQKAYTCARMGVTTEAFLARLRREDVPASYFCDEGLTALPGGAVVADAHGTLIGGVGISGLAPAEDQAIADALASFAAQYLSEHAG